MSLGGFSVSGTARHSLQALDDAGDAGHGAPSAHASVAQHVGAAFDGIVEERGARGILVGVVLECQRRHGRRCDT
jgi:hypothetical protein